jgi:putative CocE/NonD family hydrolase
MHVIAELARTVTEDETWMTLSDGCRIALRIWRPADAETHPVPAILEYLPYRKRELTAERDVPMHTYFAGHGYACVRADIRGSGDSDGVLTDEYRQQELDDGAEILRWIGQQAWCTGRVGMIGISWGGFNGLQLAAMQPPELGAVITLCSSDDRYADDVHHMGGCLLGDNLSWASTMLDQSTCPPDPALVGDRWRDMWLERLRGSDLWLEKWLQHQRRDDYWKHGSVCEHYSAIQCPVYAVSGWADGYCNAVFRLLAGLSVPRKGLVGPWAHNYPHQGQPGPAIGFLQECLRFYDQWLKDVDTGIMDEPMLRVWMQDTVAPSARYSKRPGRWVTEPEWPSCGISHQTCGMTDGFGLSPGADQGPAEDRLEIQSPLFVGLYGGKWCSYNAPPDLPHDQRDEDGGALAFESDRLTEALEICGEPTVTLDVESDKPVAMVAVRLIDVAANDQATRVSYGLLNLTHRDSHQQPTPLEPGQRYQVTVRLKHIAQRFPAGHSLRVSISTVYWPLAWPSPEPVKLTIDPGKSALHLPVREPRPEEEAQLAPFGDPEMGPEADVDLIQPTREEWQVIRDLAHDRNTLEVFHDDGTKRFNTIDLEVSSQVTERYTHAYANHESLRGWCEWVRRFRRGDWETTTITRTQLTADRAHFRIRATLDAYEGATRIFADTWDREIERDLV